MAPKKIAKKSSQAVKTLTPEKVMTMLEKSGATRMQICKTLAEALVATKAIVADGEIIANEPDTRSRLHAAEIVLDIIGERKLIVPQGETHYHFTNILQLMEAYERGDPRAVSDAQKFFDASGVSLNQLNEQPNNAQPSVPGGSASEEDDVEPESLEE